MSVQIDDLRVGSQTLSSKEFYPPHKTRIESVLSNLFSNHPFSGSERVPFTMRLDAGTPILSLEGREIALNPKDIKEIERVVQYYQHVGVLERKEEDCPLIQNAAKKSVKEMCTASIPGANGKVISGMHITEDTFLLIRNGISSIAPPGGVADHISEQLGYYTGLLGAFFAFREIDQGWSEHKRATLVGDEEGRRRAAARIVRGGVVSGASATYLASQFLAPVLTPTAMACMDVATQGLFGLGSILNIGMSTLGALRCYNFNKRMDEYLENTDLPEEKKMIGVLQFLKDQISVTAEEKQALLKEIDPTLPETEKKLILEEKIAKRTEVKIKHLKRRTSNKSLALILANADALLAKLNSKATLLQGMQEAAIFIGKIKTENNTKFILYSVSVVASVLALLGMLLFIFCPPLAALPFIVYGVAGTIYLGTSIYTAIDAFKKKEHVIEYNPADLATDLALGAR